MFSAKARRSPKPQSLLLPAATQSLIKLDQRQQLVALGLSETQLSVKKIAVRVQRVQQCVHSPAIAQVGQPRAILQRRYQQILLSSDLTDLSILHQRIRNFPKRGLNRLLVIDQRDL